MAEATTSDTITYREALRQGLRDVLNSNPDTFLIGEDVGKYGGAFAVSMGLLEEFGPERVMDAPLSEAGFTGAGIGAAMAGMHPIVEIMTVNFSLLAMDQIVNNAATLRHMTNGQVTVPIVIRMSCGIGRQLAAQHSHSWEPLFAHIPGLIVYSIATHTDARHALALALQEKTPVILFEYTSLLNTDGRPDASPSGTSWRSARIMRTGKDITLISYGAALHRCMHAAEELDKEGISCEVIDLRCLRPIDSTTLLSSVSKTHCAAVVEDAWQTLGLGAEIAARIQAERFYDLDAPVLRLGGREIPIPYPLHLEEACIPQAHQIVSEIKQLIRPKSA